MTAPGEEGVPKSKFLRRHIMTAPLPVRLIEQSPGQVSSPHNATTASSYSPPSGNMEEKTSRVD